MGKKRKSRMSSLLNKKKPRVEKLDTLFNCPFCSHSNSVACTLDKKDNIGEASCSICYECYFTDITPLTEPIDIYSEWIDKCVEVNTDVNKVERLAYGQTSHHVQVECF